MPLAGYVFLKIKENSKLRTIGMFKQIMISYKVFIVGIDHGIYAIGVTHQLNCLGNQMIFNLNPVNQTILHCYLFDWWRKGCLVPRKYSRCIGVWFINWTKHFDSCSFVRFECRKNIMNLIFRLICLRPFAPVRLISTSFHDSMQNHNRPSLQWYTQITKKKQCSVCWNVKIGKTCIWQL